MRLPVILGLRPSRRLAAALVIAHTAAGLACLAIPAPSAFAAGLAVAVSLVLSLRKALRPPFAGLRLLADGSVEAWRADGAPATLRVLSDTTVLSWLVVLRLRGEAGNFALTLPPDAVADGGHRELRLWLRWKASAA